MNEILNVPKNTNKIMRYNFKRFDEHNGMFTNFQIILIDVEVIIALDACFS